MGPQIYDLGSRLLTTRFNFANSDVNQHRAGTKRASNALDKLRDDPEALEVLVANNALDMELWEFARGLFLTDAIQEFKEDVQAMEDLMSMYTSPNEKSFKRDEKTVSSLETTTTTTTNSLRTMSTPSDEERRSVFFDKTVYKPPSVSALNLKK